MNRKNLGLGFYAVAVAIPIAFSIFGKWYAGVWGFSFPLDFLGWVILILGTIPFWGPAVIIGMMLREPARSSDKRVN